MQKTLKGSQLKTGMIIDCFEGLFIPCKEYDGHGKQNTVCPSLLLLSLDGEIQAARLKFIK